MFAESGREGSAHLEPCLSEAERGGWGFQDSQDYALWSETPNQPKHTQEATSRQDLMLGSTKKRGEGGG